MRYKLIACEIFYRECCALLAETVHTVDVEFLPKALHDLGCERMQARLQACIDAVPADAGYAAILLAYGLCNNGIVGLHSTHLPLVVPRAHDCITVFLGSRQVYSATFAAEPGTFYRTSGWLERGEAEGSDAAQTVQARLGLFQEYARLVEQYGEDNARYIVETMGDATAHYDQLSFIRMGLGCDAHFAALAQAEAQERKWRYSERSGDLRLLRNLINGIWDDDMLVVDPGQSIKAVYDDNVIGTVAAQI